MGKLRPFVQKESYMPNKKWIPFVIGNGYTTVDGASGPAPEWDTEIGNPVSFNALTPWPLRQLSVAFSPKQDLHGYDSPWPAGGGVNKLPKCVAGTYTSTNCTAVVSDDGTITLSGTAQGSSETIIIPLVESVYTPIADFYLHTLNSSPMSSCSLAIENSSSPSATTINTGMGAINAVSQARTGDNCGVLVNRSRLWIAGGQTVSGTIHPMICLTNTAQDYSPYSNLCPISGWASLTVYHSGADTSNPQTISITIGPTVYSGTLDVLTGVVTVTSFADVYDGSEDEEWAKFGSGSASAYAMIIRMSATRKASTEAKANYLKYISPNATWGSYNAFISFQSNAASLSVVTGIKTITTVADWKTYLASNPLTIWCELSTPRTIQLTPQEVSSLLGENVLFSDSNGDLTVTYRSN